MSIDIFEPTGFGRFDSSIFGLRLNLDRAITEPFDAELLRLTLLSFHSPIGADHRSYFEGLQDDERKSLAVSLFTLSQHETKHFHDLLITPYGSMLMRQYTRLALLSFSCFHDIFLRNSAIMLPLRAWASDWELYGGMSPAPAKPSENVRELASVIDTMSMKLKTFDEGITQLPTTLSHLTASSILEGLAIIVQEHKIVSNFGENGLRSFRQIFDASAAQLYYGALSFVTSFFEVRPTADIVSLLLFASLFGNFQDADPNRFRYPKDVLVQMMIWLKEHRPLVFQGASSEDAFSCVDEYFEQELGDDLQGMQIQAAKANEGVLAAFSDITRKYEEHSPVEGERARGVLELFSNFRDVQAPTSANVMINPSWYISVDYSENAHLLPTPIFYIETEKGFPADDDLERVYYVQSESRIDVSGLSGSEKQRFKLHTDTNVVRIAQRLAPLFSIQPDKSASKGLPTSFMFKVPDLDLTAWYRGYDQIYSLLRSLIEGFEGKMMDADRRELDFMFATVGVRVYSNGRIRDPVDLPTDWTSEAVDPTIRKMMSDPKFSAVMEHLRAGAVERDQYEDR
jgi:hypothetical protein